MNASGWWVDAAALTSAAYHESGHATVASLHGFSLRRVLLREPRSRHEEAGLCEVADHLSEIDDRPFSYMIYLEAGAAAEQRGTGRLIPGGNRRDRAQAIALASLTLDREPTDPRVRERVERAALVARALIAANWAWTDRGAQMLMTKRELSGREFFDLKPQGPR